MTDDGLRRLLQATAASAPDPSDLRRGAELRAARIRRRRARVAASGGSVLATVAVLAAAVALRPDGEVADPTPPVVATAPGPTGSPDPMPDRTGSPGPMPDESGSPGPVPDRTGSPGRTPGPSGPGAAAPAFGPPAFVEDFSGPLDPGRWIVYDGGVNANLSRWSTEDVSVRDGTLRITARRPGGVPPYTTGGVGALSLAREYGRFSVRLRMTPGPGVVGQVVLSPLGTGDPGTFLTLGGARRSGTLTGRPGTDADEITLPAALTEYRTVVVEWSPRLVRWTLDGVELGRYAGAGPRGQHYLALQVLALGPDCGGSPLIPTCPGPVALPQVLTVDRVTIQPYTGG